MRASIAAPLLFAVSSLAQSFDVASVKPSAHPVGRDYNNLVTVRAMEFSGKNVTLKRLIGEAYGLQPYQVSGPKWLDDIEYDVDAKADKPATGEQLRLMLRALLTNRFHLAVHRQTKELRLYELVVDKNGPKIHPAADSETGEPGFRHFHGELQQLANIISVQLSIPVNDDPGTPGIANLVTVPVIDKTGLAGIYNVDLDIKLEPGRDMFALWQRKLQEELGLKMESRKAEVELLVVDSAERTPTGN
jgi:uncharacterized protein (TIGR03435 family)